MFQPIPLFKTIYFNSFFFSWKHFLYAYMFISSNNLQISVCLYYRVFYATKRFHKKSTFIKRVLNFKIIWWVNLLIGVKVWALHIVGLNYNETRFKSKPTNYIKVNFMNCINCNNGCRIYVDNMTWENLSSI